MISGDSFLKDMYEDGYFPDFLVDKIKAILISLCEKIEEVKPTSLEQLYKLTNESTELINDLAEEFEDNDSELETAARESIAESFEIIAQTYNFEADIEELIANRDW